MAHQAKNPIEFSEVGENKQLPITIGVHGYFCSIINW